MTRSLDDFRRERAEGQARLAACDLRLDAAAYEDGALPTVGPANAVPLLSRTQIPVMTCLMSPNSLAAPADIRSESAPPSPSAVPPDPGEDPIVTRCSASPPACMHEVERSGVTAVELPRGRAVAYSARSPEKTTPNEDSLLVMTTDDGVLVLAVADGCGGFAAGNIASRVSIEVMASRLNAATDGEEVTATVLSAFTAANRAVLDLGVGAGTTLSILTVEGTTARAYHAGDSPILITGQRGRIKLHPVAHSPTAYAMQAGELTETQAMVHVDRHIITNMVGSMDMHVEVSSPVQLAPRDTVLVASDGLSDNLRLRDVIEVARKGELEASLETLVERCDGRMASSSIDQPGKPDDLSVILYRPLDHSK